MKKSKLLFVALFVCISSNVFTQWQFCPGFLIGYNTTNGHMSISVYDTNKAVVAGTGPGNVAYMHRTTNAGVTWTQITTTGITFDLFCVWAVDDNTIYVGDGGAVNGLGGNAKVWKTTNGGTSWTSILSTGGSAGFINGIVFSKSNPQVGICQSDPPAGGSTAYWIAKTINGGSTWNIENPTPSGTASAENSVICIDANFYGFAMNTVAKVGITTNGGTSWAYPNLVGAGGTFISAFAFSTDKLNGVASGDALASTISRTTNGGTSWASQSVAPGTMTGYSNLKWIHGSNIVYLSGTIGAGGCIKRSSDGGVTWTQMTTAGITGIQHFEYFKAADSRIYLYAVAADGSAIRYTDNSLVGIDPNNQNVPNSFALEQNYPNPFNPSTTIKYSVPQPGSVTIKVYNSLGEVVRTVVEKYHSTGNYEEIVDMDGMASGVYYYTMLAGDFKDTKRMVIVK